MFVLVLFFYISIRYGEFAKRIFPHVKLFIKKSGLKKRQKFCNFRCKKQTVDRSQFADIGYNKNHDLILILFIMNNIYSCSSYLSGYCPRAFDLVGPLLPLDWPPDPYFISLPSGSRPSKFPGFWIFILVAVVFSRAIIWIPSLPFNWPTLCALLEVPVWTKHHLIYIDTVPVLRCILHRFLCILVSVSAITDIAFSSPS